MCLLTNSFFLFLYSFFAFFYIFVVGILTACGPVGGVQLESIQRNRSVDAASHHTSRFGEIIRSMLLPAARLRSGGLPPDHMCGGYQSQFFIVLNHDSQCSTQLSQAISSPAAAI